VNVLIEALGSPVWGTLFPYLRPVVNRLVGLDIDPLAFGLYMVDRGYLVPQYSDDRCFDMLWEICRREKIDLVLPSVNEGLLEWSRRREDFARAGIQVLISPPDTIAMCQDKWQTYQFFVQHNVPTPKTSLEHGFAGTGREGHSEDRAGASPGCRHAGPHFPRVR
jgi:carbamoyl-phosphate synthase large subunit